MSYSFMFLLRGRLKQILPILLCCTFLTGCLASEETPQQPPKQWALEPPGTVQEHTDELPPVPLSSDRGEPLFPYSTPLEDGEIKNLPLNRQNKAIAPGWTALLKRLQKDGHDPRVLEAYFRGLADYHPGPMAVKVEELYKIAFVRKPRVPASTPSVPSKIRIFKGFVTKANIEKCHAFLNEHAKAFATMEKRYGVPKETIVALLFVETKLGTYMGRENALWSLAAMAASTSPELVKDSVTHLPLTESHEPWLQSKLTEKSDWAYKELKALISHCDANNLNPQDMPGSVYGAIGICQFMPSNLKPYSADGDDDGVIDIFTPADAIHSTAKYLKGHGWSAPMTVEKQRATLKRYNNLTAYANTILTLAESIRTGVVHTAPPDAPKAPATAKGNKKASGATKKKPKGTPKTTSGKKQPKSTPAKKVKK